MFVYTTWVPTKKPCCWVPSNKQTWVPTTLPGSSLTGQGPFLRFHQRIKRFFRALTNSQTVDLGSRHQIKLFTNNAWVPTKKQHGLSAPCGFPLRGNRVSVHRVGSNYQVKLFAYIR